MRVLRLTLAAFAMAAFVGCQKPAETQSVEIETPAGDVTIEADASTGEVSVDVDADAPAEEEAAPAE